MGTRKSKFDYHCILEISIFTTFGNLQPQIKIRDASVTVRPDWVTIEEMDFPRLSKLSLPNIKEGNKKCLT